MSTLKCYMGFCTPKRTIIELKKKKKKIRESPVIGKTIVVPGAFRSCGNRASPRMGVFPNKPPSPDSHFGLDRALTDARAKSIQSTVVNFTYKWPHPRVYRSIPPGLRTNHFSTRRRMWALKGVGGWSQGNTEAVLHEKNRGLGINVVGQWTLHKWCLIASVTTVFLLGLTCLVVSVLTCFSSESSVRLHL